MRSIRTTSAVTAGSASNPFSEQHRFSLSASTSHCSAETASVRGQYTCTPRPLLIIKGLGSDSFLQKSRTADTAASLVGYSYVGPQSKSRKKDFNSCAFVPLRPASLVGSLNVLKAK